MTSQFKSTYNYAVNLLEKEGYSVKDVPRLNFLELIKIPGMGQSSLEILRKNHPAKAEITLPTWDDVKALEALVHHLGGKIQYK